MGGRGSLSRNKHKFMYDKESIKSFMNKTGVRVIGADRITNKSLSLVSEAMLTLASLQKKHGKLIDTVVIGNNRSADFAFNSNFKIKKSDGKEVSVGRTLIIPKGTLQAGRKQVLKEVKYANKHNIVVAKNIKQMITHEFGHAMHYALKRQNIDLYNEFERKFTRLVNTPKARVHLSQYASSKAYNGKIGSHEYVAEAVTHIIRNTRTRKGQDMIDLVHDYIGRVDTVDFSRYGVKNRSTSQPKTTGRKIKRKRKTR